MNAQVETADSSQKIKCEIDGVMVHAIQSHLRSAHPEWTIERYRETYPDAPLLSPFALSVIQKKKAELAPGAAHVAPLAASTSAQSGEPALVQAAFTYSHKPMHELFELGQAPAAMNAKGDPIPVQVVEGLSGEHLHYLQNVDSDYVYNIDLLKKVLVAFALNKPLYLWGKHGTGKTTVAQQVCARTGRPVMRVQHTLNMQESEVLGQWTVRNGATEYQLGPLPMAMIMGWAYVADEYDRALPGVLALYQPVLEGQPLVIKDAPPHYRKITAHPDFRFIATGNTNGCGDETGLYQGTIMQDAANYSRFGVTEEVDYPDAKTEENILRSKVRIPAPVAAKMVKFANDIRKEFSNGKMSMTVSPRELISAAQIGIAFGGEGEGWKKGVMLAYGNRLPRVDKKAVEELLQRYFG